MDQFEATTRCQTISLVEKLDFNRHEIAVSRIALFSAAICRLLLEFNERYSLIVTAGTSGLYMRELVTAVFRALAVQAPPTICLPVIRFEDNGALFDNSPLAAGLPGRSGNQDPPKHILFVDDEIRRGTTARACLDLLIRSGYVDADRPLLCTIVAENHFFEWHWTLPGVSVRYFAPARLLYGLQHNIAHCLPADLVAAARTLLGPSFGCHELMALVMAGAMKRKGERTGFFDETPAHRLAAEMPNYQAIRNEFLRDFESWVGHGVRQFRDGTIEFRF